ncbi:MAG: endolytic transglycosylase MltG [Acidobacteria bacterium]|nr:endolytic transglycosylase MltG [Acidobacteriota bacterium]
MRTLRRVLVYGLLLALGVIAWLGYELLSPYGQFQKEGVFVEIAHGSSVRGIAQQLEQSGVIRNRFVFELLARVRRHKPLSAGEYFFDRPRRPSEVLQVLAEGRVYTVSVTVPEGLTMFDIADVFEKAALSQHAEFLQAAQNAEAVRELAPQAKNLEGFLFPATYQFPRHVTAQEITQAMVRRFREAWNELTQGKSPAIYSAAEIVTMASLVEKETGTPSERPVIAGVFFNRLRRNVALQCDPTVIYGLRLSNRFNGKLGNSGLHFDSPYNTYKYRGLPPGPIANPGEASLRAALYPPYVEYLYFVANTEGGHWFSKTLSEHNENVARYRRRKAEQNQEQPKGASDAKPSPEKHAKGSH